MPQTIKALYCDGGLLGTNPCAHGGTWAWCQVNAQDERIATGSGLLLPSQVAPLPDVTNNLTELIAVLRGMRSLPDGWSGKIYTDSQVTIYRVGHYKPTSRGNLLKTVPQLIADEIPVQLARLGRLCFVLLDGHPTAEQLASGIGKRGHPVSIHNKWADDACNEVKAAYWAEKARNL